MKENEHKELIERMVDVLREHSAPYKEGAWEQFAAAQGRRKKIIPLWYLSGAAAILILGVTLFLNRGRLDSPIRQVNTKIAASSHEINKPSSSAEKKESSLGSKFEKKTTITNPSTLARLAPKQSVYPNRRSNGMTEILPGANGGTKYSEISKNGQFDLKKSQPMGEYNDAIIQKNTPKEDNEQLAENHHQDKEENALMRMLKEDSPYASSEEEPKMDVDHPANNRKWNVGVVLAPSLTKERLNMGGGVAVAYHISNKLSVGSGVSLVDLGLHNSDPFNPSPSGQLASPVSSNMLSSRSTMLSAKSSETKELTSVNTKLLALDIPIDFKYELSKQFYVSGGVSFFAVLNEDRVNNYTTTTPTNRTLQNTEGYAFSQPEFQIKNVSEVSEETPYQGNGYSGFLNFSVGRKMPVFKKIGLSVEPFIKIPIGELSKQDMNLRYGGVRVITSF